MMVNAGRILLLLSLLFSDLSLASNQSEKENIIIIAGDNWCPINCGEDDALQGYMIDIARLALKDSGYTVKYREVPWPRAIAMGREGEIHAIVGAFEDDAPGFKYPRNPLLVMSSNSLFTRIENFWRYEGFDSFEKIKLGAVKSYDYGEDLNSYIEANRGNASRINQMAGDNVVERNVKSLLRSRIDVMVESAPVFWYTANKMGAESLLQEVGMVSAAEPCYITFSPNVPGIDKVIAAFDQGVEKLYRNGTLKTLGAAYGLPVSVQPKIQLSNE